MAKMSYRDAGVNYDVLDGFKRACQKLAGETGGALLNRGMREVPSMRGESAFLIETPGEYLAHVEEALGTKVLVADAMYQLTGESLYANVAIDDVSTIVNDLCTCGALPISVAMYTAVGDGEYLADARRADDLARGFAEGCRLSGAAWGGGETQMLKGMVTPGTAILGGSAIGRIAPKELRIPGEAHDGDVIIGLASSGVQTNGLTLCRSLVERLPKGYLTPLADGRTYGAALLDPSVIYVNFIAACQQAHVPLHYAVHMTGHGWRKLMRLESPLVYRITQLPRPQPVFDCIVAAASLDAGEAYGTFNMGCGFAVYVAPADADRCLALASAAGYTAWIAGRVCREGSRKAVILEPINVTYEADSLKIR